jgi:hypothetical protein
MDINQLNTSRRWQRANFQVTCDACTYLIRSVPPLKGVI